MENKIFKIIFIVFVGLALVFGVINIKQSIKITNNISEEDREEYSNALEDVKLRVLDTDLDGLTDWDEINLYKTSPYLPDTDSDGILDKEEIEKGTDPNCEEGKVCGSGIINLVDEAKNEIDSINNEQEADVLNTDFSEESLGAMEAMEKGEIPKPEQIRALLLDSGISKDQIEGVSDEDLLNLFEELSKE